MTIRLLAVAFMMLLVAGVSTSASAAATFSSFSLIVNERLLTPSTPLPGATVVGTRTSVNVANTYTDLTPGGTGVTFTIKSSGTNPPTVFGDDSTLDQIGFTDALITYTSRGSATADPVDLEVQYAFGFNPVTVNSQTYGIQIVGKFGRGFSTATNDAINASSLVRFSNGTVSADNQIASNLVYKVDTANSSNSFSVPSPAATELISCLTTLPTAVCSSDVMQARGVIHFDRVGDSLKNPGSWLTVRAEDGAAVKDFLATAAAADAAALPEPNSLLLLATALAGLGLFRLKRSGSQGGEAPRD